MATTNAGKKLQANSAARGAARSKTVAQSSFDKAVAAKKARNTGSTTPASTKYQTNNGTNYAGPGVFGQVNEQRPGYYNSDGSSYKIQEGQPVPTQFYQDNPNAYGARNADGSANLPSYQVTQDQWLDAARNRGDNIRNNYGPSIQTAQTIQPAGAPLQYATSGASGRAGAQGFNTAGLLSSNPDAPGNFSVTSTDRRQQALNAIDEETRKKILESDSNYSTTGTGNQASYDARNAARDAITRDANAQKDAIINQANESSKSASEVIANDRGTNFIASDARDKASKDPQQEIDDSIKTSALKSAIQEMPEAAPLMEALQNTMNIRNQQITDAGSSYDQGVKNADRSYREEQALIDTFKSDSKFMYDKAEDIADTQRDRRQTQVAKDEANINEQLTWQEEKLVREQQKQKRQQLDQMNDTLALSGGFGSSAGLKAIDDAEIEYNQAITDLKTEYGFKRTDVALEAMRLRDNAENVYENTLYKALDDYRKDKQSINSKSLLSSQAKRNEKQRLEENKNIQVTAARDKLSADILSTAKYVNDEHTKSKAADRAKEATALGRIEYLLKNYPRESVADAIREIGKDVTSFDVEILATQPTLSEIEKARKAVSGGSSVSGYKSSGYQALPFEMQDESEPEITFDEFIEEMVGQEEAELLETMNLEDKAEFIENNREEWEDEYDAQYVAGIRSVQNKQTRESIMSNFGEDVVNAASLVMDSTYTGTNAVKNASKALGVPESSVATALVALRQSGDIRDSEVLSAGGQKGWDSLRKELERDTFYSVYKGAQSAVSRIGTAINTGGDTGIADIMAINAFQNGIVDPGATVREGDVWLLESAVAWSEKWGFDKPETRQLWIDKINKGKRLPKSMLNKMLELAEGTRLAYGRDFKDITLPKYRQQVTLKGLPSSVLDPYMKEFGGASATSSKYSDFTTSLGYE